MLIRRRFASPSPLVLSLFIAIFIFTGCSKQKPAEEQEPSGKHPPKADILSPDEVKARLKKLACPADQLVFPPGHLGGTFRFNILETPNSLDPAWIRDTASHEAAAPLHDGLIEFDPVTLEIVPCIAESWEISKDGLVYTFHLRDGVFFHDDPCFPGGQGRQVAAQDFKYSFERVVDPRVASPGAWMFLDFVDGAKAFRDGISARLEIERRRKGELRDPGNADRFRSAEDSHLQELARQGDQVAGLTCPDSRTFVIRLSQPFSPFLYRMGHSFSWPVPQEAVEKYGDNFFQHPVGAGPFKFVEWIPTQHIILERNPKYWGKDPKGNPLPYLDRIEISQIADSNSEHFELLAGHLDLNYPIPIDRWEGVFSGDLELQPEYTHYQVQSSDFMRIEYIGFLMTHPLFSDIRIRKAFNFAINREEITSTILRYRAQPNLGWVVPPSMPKYPRSEGIYGYDPQKARELLSQAGYPEGKGFPALTLQLNAMGQENIKLAEIIQGYLAAVGIHITLQKVDWRVHLDTVRQGEVPFYRMGWLNDYPSPENSLMLLATASIPPDGENYARFSNAEFDRLYAEALAAVDPAQQNQLYAQAEKIAVEQAPWLFLYDRHDFRLLSKRVRNFPMNALDRRSMKYVWLSE
ncbi:MAG: ABC transporter substrate-binding protein [Candidatus Omnitrophica bacterium]|nr:ABC transporter substrate-binding protein [bacterium]MBV6481378.1 Heme-binding protein A [bacterium]MCC6733412.1 ABC transporter substrate-binding protein [Candidatus Omnitrophota bacterium]